LFNLIGSELSIEHAQLTPVVEQFCEYLSAQEDVEAARFVTGDYSSRDTGSVTRMLQQLQWDTLEELRASQLWW
jgi:hypothetical protein